MNGLWASLRSTGSEYVWRLFAWISVFSLIVGTQVILYFQAARAIRDRVKENATIAETISRVHQEEIEALERQISGNKESIDKLANLLDMQQLRVNQQQGALNHQQERLNHQQEQLDTKAPIKAEGKRK